MGFGAGLTSGQAMNSPRLRMLCGLGKGEEAVCCLNIGTVVRRKGAARIRALPAMFTSELRDMAQGTATLDGATQ
jgi:hypothetical protein